MIQSVKGFSVVNEAEVHVFVKFLVFFYDPMDIGNMISDSSTFYKSSLNLWKFSVHILFKATLKDLSIIESLLAYEWMQLCDTLNIF